MQRSFLITGAILGLLAVIIGAFAAHGLKPLLESSALDSFETGVKYQFYHALLFLILGNINSSVKISKVVYYLLLMGVVFFSGSIYALSTNQLSPVDFSGIALITPLGGILLIASWILILVDFLKLKKG